MADHDAERYVDPRGRDLRSPLAFYLWLIAPQKWWIVRAAVYGSSWMIGLTIAPFLLSQAIDHGLRTRDTGALVGWVIALCVVGVATAVIGGLRHNTMTKVRTYAGLQTVRVVIRHSTHLGAMLTRKTSSGEVVTIALSDGAAISNALTVTGPGVGSVVAYAVVAVLLSSVSWLLAVVVLTGVPVFAVTVGPLLNRTRTAMAPYREQSRVLTTGLIDIATGLRVLNGLGGKQARLDRYREDSRKLVGQGYRIGAASSWSSALGIGLPALFLAVVTWIAARQAAEGLITIGQFIAVYGYVAMLSVPVASFIEGAQQITAAAVSVRRMIRFLALAPVSDDGARGLGTEPAELCDPVSGAVIPAGLLTAVVSAEPAAGFAVLERLARFQETTATWGGVPLAEAPLLQVRSRILLADNDAALFAGSIREAVAGRRDAVDASLAAAIEAAVARDIVEALPDELDARLDAQARNLSGGQQQRLRMARALYADPEVLLLAEPTSAVDAHTEAKMAARLRTARAGRTTVVTTSSPLVLDHVDVVVHLVAGQVARIGTHQELLATDPAYRAVVVRQSAAQDEEAVP